MQAAAPIRLADVTLGYDRHPAVHHLTGLIPAGALLAVCGPNGAGKSTLLKGIAGLIPLLGGRIDRGGLGPRDIAYLPQAMEIDRSFPIDVLDFVSLGALRRKGLFGRLDQAERERVSAALAAVRLEGFESRGLDTLSGGQMQRALFARLIVEDQQAILLDEPFGAVDEATTEDLLHLIGHWRDEGRTVVAVLHDYELVRRVFPQTLLIAREPVFWGATAEALTSENLARARGMVEALDEAAPVCGRDSGEARRANAF
ncbi:metal ABC transporter ATP-binding protein [Methylocystis heyeri]|uniref:ATP-binding cassette domain-containing protein n=1 Tax=Methylocystis heyeri TaxID=391905 RepID=A0A6B8KD81_9HYPH|nr:ABC transporter ATP-binding protein [Methylocystis heyeri]QGM45647.1 ATP-binding cassette domain-containing protein [Methylocystis heyeri]